jgi:pectinesterase
MIRFFTVLGLICLQVSAAAASPAVTVTVRNSTNLARPSETIVLQIADLRRLLPVDDIRRVHVRDERSGQDLLTQAVDTNDDGVFEELIFQADFAPGETRKFVLVVGERRIPLPEDFRAYGRFVQERRDDFAWENDQIAHRMYGAALETWPQEPLTSSAVDVWTKRVERMVINNWYMVDDYHRDHGEGSDFYSAGTTRGCGGNGIWIGGRLYTSTNFHGSRVLANGPIRVMFELMYPAWDAGGVRVSEVKRITLDAGQNFNRFESHYRFENGTSELTDAIGIRKGPNPSIIASREQGSFRTWEALPDDAGWLGQAVLLDPASLLNFTEDKSNFLITAKIPADGVVAYYAGFGWSKHGFPAKEDWDRYVAQFAARLRSPVEVTMAAQ